MADVIEINVRKFQASLGDGSSIATYESGSGVHVQIWRGRTLVNEGTLSHTEYAEFRKEITFVTLPEYSTPNHEHPPGGTNVNGNTLGRVVGETSPASVPASEANQEVVVENEEEAGWWSTASPWVHGTLDGLGFIPGLGAIPDVVNAVVYAAEGDLENAGVSAFAAIPLIGDAAKGGVLIGKHAHKIGAHASKEAAERATKEAAEKKAKDTRPSRTEDGGKAKRETKPDKCKPLENGLPGSEYRGGKHSKIRKAGSTYVPPRESHHMPASSAYSSLNGKPIRSSQMPTIQMDKADHMKTASWGSSQSAKTYRLEQERKIKTGKAGYIDAMMMDILDIRSKFGDKYDIAITQMLAWSKCKGYI